MIIVRTSERVFELRRRWQQILDFNGELLKLSNGWLKASDRWEVKKLPSTWRAPGFNPTKLQQRLEHLQGYFRGVAAWATRLRSRTDKVIDLFAPDIHLRMHVVRDFLTVGSITAEARPAGSTGSAAAGPVGGRMRSESMSNLSEQVESAAEAAENDLRSSTAQTPSPQMKSVTRGRSASVGASPMSGTSMDQLKAMGKGETVALIEQLKREREAAAGGGSARKAEPFALSPVSDSDQPEDEEEDPAEEGLVPVIVVVPLSCIALLVYPPEPEPVGLTDSPKIDDGHLGRIAMSLTDLSLIYQEAGADMSEYDEDDIIEQQKLQKTRSKLLEDLETVNAALAEARSVAADAQDHSPARASLSSGDLDLSARASLRSDPGDPGPPES